MENEIETKIVLVIHSKTVTMQGSTHKEALNKIGFNLESENFIDDKTYYLVSERDIQELIDCNDYSDETIHALRELVSYKAIA